MALPAVTSVRDIIVEDVASVSFDAKQISDFGRLLDFIRFKERLHCLQIEGDLDFIALLNALRSSKTKSIVKLRIYFDHFCSKPGFADLLREYSHDLEELVLDRTPQGHDNKPLVTKNIKEDWQKFHEALIRADKLKSIDINLQDYITHSVNGTTVKESDFVTTIVDLPSIKRVVIHPDSFGVYAEGEETITALFNTISTKGIQFHFATNARSSFQSKFPSLFDPKAKITSWTKPSKYNDVVVQAAPEEQMEAPTLFTLQNIPWRIDTFWEAAQTKGHGVTIALLDSGIDVSHPHLFNSIKGVKAFVPNEVASIDYSGHGTHCAGILVGKQKDNVPVGIAPEAKLLVGKVIDQHGVGTVKWLIEGIKWAIEQKANVISLSLGTSYPSHELMSTINNAINSGIIIVTSAANYGSRDSYNIGYPARFGNVLCVGSHTRNGQPSEFTSTGREVDFLAPGERIWTTAPSNSWKQITGTSAATPFVAGLSALLIALGRIKNKQPKNVITMREILRTMCTKSGHHDQQSGYGVLNPMKVFAKPVFDDSVHLQFDPTEDDTPIVRVPDNSNPPEPDDRLAPHSQTDTDLL